MAGIFFLVAGLAAGCRVPARTPPPPLLAGTSWRVVAMEGRDSPAAPTLVFESGERAAGSTGCNNYFATVEILGSGMSFGKVGSTRRGCPGAAAEQEKRFLDALANVRTHRLRGEFLELLSESGIVLIRLERSAAPTAGNPQAIVAPNAPVKARRGHGKRSRFWQMILSSNFPDTRPLPGVLEW